MRTILLLMGIFSFFNSKGQKSNVSDKEPEIIILEYFGELDVNSTRDREAEFLWNGNSVSLDLNFDNDQVDKKRFDALYAVLNDLDAFISKATSAVRNDYTDNGEVKEYLEHHHAEGVLDDPTTVNKLIVCRIGFYPENDHSYIVCDFTIGKDVTNYLIAVKFKSSLELDYITMES